MAGWAIYGRFLTRQVTGVDRYAREVVRELDSLVGDGEAVIVVPEHAGILDPLALRRIGLVHHGSWSGHARGKLDFSRRLSRNGLLGVNLRNPACVRELRVVAIRKMRVRADSLHSAEMYRLRLAAAVQGEPGRRVPA